MLSRKIQALFKRSRNFGTYHKNGAKIMAELYQTIAQLCADNGINITELCRQSGASRGSLSDLKKGRKQSLSADTLSKIAAYFGVSVDYLLRGNEEKNAIPTDSELDELVKDELVGFYGDVKKELTPGDIEDIKTLMKLRAELNRSKGK